MKSFFRLCVLLLCLSGATHVAHAQEVSSSRWIAQANAALSAGDYARAEAAVRMVIARPSVRRVERAEAYRILGILKFYGESTEEARVAFLSFLKLDPDAHLDPALVPPEAITLLEDVRIQHQTEIDAMRMTPPVKRYLALNLVPVGGQIQNGDGTKAVLVAAGFVVLAGTNLGSYAWLKQRCASDLVCGSKNENDKPQTANALRTVNLVSGGALIALYLYSVVDGVRGYRKLQARDRQRQRDNDMSFQVSASEDASSFSLSFRY
jgi:peptidoglycan hydrolase-like protein with peptidoglycan-binding domain